MAEGSSEDNGGVEGAGAAGGPSMASAAPELQLSRGADLRISGMIPKPWAGGG